MEWIKAILRPLRPFKVSLESFFFVPERNPGGLSLAAPKAFKVVKRDSFDNEKQTEFMYEEEVYHLEPLRYPFKIQLMEDLPKRMLEQLRGSIVGKSVDALLYHSWESWKEATSMETLQSKRSAARVANATFKFLVHAFRMIHPDEYCLNDLDACSKDERVATDIHIKVALPGVPHTFRKMIILGEALDPATADIHIADLVKLASGELRSNFEGELPDKLVGHEAILSKLSYEVMDNWAKCPQWGLVYGGNIYIIYLILPVMVGNQRRCSFISSGPLYIDDRKYPYFPLMLYMMTSSHMTHDELVATLGVVIPSGCRLKSPKESNKAYPEPVFTKGCSSYSLSTAQVVYFTTSLDPSTRLPFRRLSFDDQIINHGPRPNRADPTFLLEHVITGTASIVYQANGFIVKTSRPKCQEYLDNEANIYRHLMKTNASKYIPTYYGCFAYRNLKAIILSDEGSPFYDLREAWNELKADVFNAVVEIHRANVFLDELESNSILIGERGPVIRDFSYASMGHACPGIHTCPELLDLREMLEYRN
ncbi:hypothetical protein CPB86DRAFT_393085 [Serendipita vermifera]|nr:hypothetical protein CPB86DRAFT_393085 [Serendipita vermifera]